MSDMEKNMSLGYFCLLTSLIHTLKMRTWRLERLSGNSEGLRETIAEDAYLLTILKMLIK